jgi:hypothetical protein
MMVKGCSLQPFLCFYDYTKKEKKIYNMQLHSQIKANILNYKNHIPDNNTARKTLAGGF